MMKLTPTQKLFLHNVLFHYSSSKDLESQVRSNVEEIMEILEDDLLYVNDSCDHDVISDDFEDHVIPNGDEQVSTWDLTNLPLCKVKAYGETGDLSFFESNGKLRFDVSTTEDLLEEGDDVTQVIRKGKEITLIDSKGAGNTFQVSKFPKEWTALLKANITYDVV